MITVQSCCFFHVRCFSVRSLLPSVFPAFLSSFPWAHSESAYRLPILPLSRVCPKTDIFFLFSLHARLTISAHHFAAALLIFLSTFTFWLSRPRECWCFMGREKLFCGERLGIIGKRVLGVYDTRGIVREFAALKGVNRYASLW